VTVGFDHASHHTGDVTGLGVIESSFGDGMRDGGDRIIGVIVDISLLRGIAVPRPVLGSWAGLSRSLSLAGTVGGDWRGGRGTSIVVGAIVSAASRHVVGSLGSELRNSRTRELVGSVAEGVDKNTGVAVLVSTGESDELIWAGGSGLIAANVDLDAAGVELGASELRSQMKADNLVTEEISTAREVGRKLERMGLSVELILLDPSTVALTDFINLEPLSFRGVELVAWNRAARSKVDFHGTGVVRPVLAVVSRPEHINGASWIGGSNEGGGLRVGSAGHSLVHSALDGAGVGDLTDGRT